MPVFSSKMTLFGKAGLYTINGMVSDMLPIHRREMGELLWRNGHPLLLQFLNRSCQFQRVPENNGRDHEIESLRTSLLLGMGTILDASVPIKEHSTGQRIPGFSFVQPDLDPSAQFHALQPFQGEERFF